MQVERQEHFENGEESNNLMAKQQGKIKKKGDPKRDHLLFLIINSCIISD